MIFLELLRYSIKLPAKQAVFKLNRIGMDMTIIYTCLLLLFVSLPSLLHQLADRGDAGIPLKLFFFLMYFFIFYYLPLVIFIVCVLALVAYIGVLISQSLYRKIKFSALWKICASTTTIPFIGYTIIALFFPVSDQWLWLFLIYTVSLMLKIITIYPRRKRRPHGFH